MAMSAALELLESLAGRSQVNLSHVLAVSKDILDRRSLKPQPGPQQAFVDSDADIVIYGGAAFAGKTFGLLFQPTRFIDNALFSAVIFRRTTVQIRNPGGLWDESVPLYRKFGAHSVSSPLEHHFPSGAKIKFAHLEYESDIYSWDGSQVPFIGFDQLEHFTRKQFFYMLSRNRSASGVKSRMRATCNPNPDSFLAEFLAWWIDQETGYPIASRAGKVRWMLRQGDDQVEWADTFDELWRKHARKDLPKDHPDQPRPKSVQFIPGTITDNKIGMAKDPDYLGNLKAMQRVERERLLGGNWKIRPAAGLMFRTEWCEVVKAAPADTEWVRYWDLAATKKIEGNDPDWTVGLRMGRIRSGTHAGKYILGDVRRMQETAGAVRRSILNTASADGEHIRVGLPQDPGQAGKDQAQQLVRALDGYQATTRIESGDKVTRFSPFSAQAEVGNVVILQSLIESADGRTYLSQLEQFPDANHKDDADATSGAYAMFQEGRGYGLFDFIREQSEAQKQAATKLDSQQPPSEKEPAAMVAPTSRSRRKPKRGSTKEEKALAPVSRRSEIPAGALLPPPPDGPNHLNGRFGGVPVGAKSASETLPLNAVNERDLGAFFPTTGDDNSQ